MLIAYARTMLCFMLIAYTRTITRVRRFVSMYLVALAQPPPDHHCHNGNPSSCPDCPNVGDKKICGEQDECICGKLTCLPLNKIVDQLKTALLTIPKFEYWGFSQIFSVKFLTFDLYTFQTV